MLLQLEIAVMTSCAKKGLIAFPNSQLLWIISSQAFIKLSPLCYTKQLWYARGILRPSFKVVQTSQVKLCISKYRLLESAIRPIFAEQVTTDYNICLFICNL